MRKEVYILAAFALLGAVFLSQGITGCVVSQSCCFPPDCDAENLCPSASPQLESPAAVSRNMILSSSGIVLFALSLVYLAMHHRKQ
jgi:hypothetical protein